MGLRDASASKKLLKQCAVNSAHRLTEQVRRLYAYYPDSIIYILHLSLPVE